MWAEELPAAGPAESASRTKSVRWFWDAAIVVLAVGIILVDAAVLPPMRYQEGYANDYRDPSLLVAFASLGLVGLCILLSLVRFAIVWGRTGTAARIVRAFIWLILLPVIFLSMFVVLPHLARLLCGEECNFLHGFADGMHGRADVGAIRAWALEHKDTKFYGEESHAKWPESIARLKPEYVVVDKEGAVVLVWGGGFGRWGLLVGPEDLQELISLEACWSEDPYLQIAPGAFVWEDKW